jgi:hypothetical protein
MTVMSKGRAVANVVVAIFVLAGCTAVGHVASSHPPATESAPTASPPPAVVMQAAKTMGAFPGNRINGPVQWVTTTYGAAMELLEPQNPAPTNPAVSVYVSQIEGDFLSTLPRDPASSPGPHRFPVLVDIEPVQGSAIGVTSEYERREPVDLSTLGSVRMFTVT